MNRKTIHTQFIVIILWCVMVSCTLSSSQNNNTERNDSQIFVEAKLEASKATRFNYVKIAEELETMYQNNQNDTKITLAYAEKMLQLGELTKAHKILAPMLSGKIINPQAIYLAAQIAYISGNYEQAESLYNTLIKKHSDYKAKAEFGMEYIYYQTNQYQKTQALSSNNRQ